MTTTTKAGRSRRKNFTGEKSVTANQVEQLTHLVEEYASRINASWQKLASSIIATARLCAEAQKGLMRPELDELKEKLNFPASTFSKLAKIGSSGLAELKDADRKLPPSLSILYELTHLGSADVKERIKRGKIHPQMKREDALALKGATKASMPEKPVPSYEDPVSMGEIFRPASMSKEKRDAFVAELKKLRKRYDYELIQPDHLVRHHEARRMDKVERRYQQLCKKRASEKLQRLVKERTGKKRQVGVPNWKAAGFGEEEVTLTVPCSRQDIDAVFGFLGIDDECEQLHRQAEREVSYDDKLARYDFFDIVDPNPPSVEEQAERKKEVLSRYRRDPEAMKQRRKKYEGFK